MNQKTTSAALTACTIAVLFACNAGAVHANETEGAATEKATKPTASIEEELANAREGYIAKKAVEIKSIQNEIKAAKKSGNEELVRELTLKALQDTENLKELGKKCVAYYENNENEDLAKDEKVAEIKKEIAKDLKAVEELPKTEEDLMKEVVNAMKNDQFENMATPALQAFAIWRAEQNDVQKRLGDLHFAHTESGAWARVYAGEFKSRDLTPDFNGNFQAVQVGYDHAVTDQWRIGAAAGTMKTKSNIEGGDVKGHLHGITLYGTYEGDHNDYLDIVGKYSKLDNDVKTADGVYKYVGDYDTHGLSLSVEYGMRFDLTPEVYVLPQVEVNYGRLAKEDTTYDVTDAAGATTRAAVHHDAVDSLAGRLGLDVGHVWDKGDVRARASVSHEFQGKVKTHSEIDGQKIESDVSGKSTWFNLGIGGTYSINDACYVYTNVERSFRGKVRTEWRGDLGLRWNF